VGDQIVPADDALAVLDHERQQVEDRRLNGDWSIVTAQLAPFRVERVVFEKIKQIKANLLSPTAFDPVRDFAPISAVANTIFAVAVSRSVPAHSLADLVRLARAQPGRLVWVPPKDCRASSPWRS
jgi:hypothetical protein